MIRNRPIVDSSNEDNFHRDILLRRSALPGHSELDGMFNTGEKKRDRSDFFTSEAVLDRSVKVFLAVIRCKESHSCERHTCKKHGPPSGENL
jgi:hypothetical protein